MSGAGLGATDVRAAEARERPVAAAPFASKPAAGCPGVEGQTGALGASTPGGWLSRLRKSVWSPILARAAGILVGMLALGGIGAWSTLSGVGVPLALASAGASVGEPAPSSTTAPRAVATTTAAPTDSSAAVAPTAGAQPGTAGTETAGSGIAPDGRVVLNLATAEELTQLPRVGPKRAESILALRRKLGRFKQATDLLRVKGIGRKTLQLMLPKLVVDAPKPEAPPPRAP